MGLIQNLVLSVFTIVLLAGCGAHELNRPVDSPKHRAFNLEEDSLWGLTIEQRGHEKFSGIIVLKNSENMLTLALLDPTGLKLFEENISNNGTVSLLQNVSFFEDHQLPEYLGTVVYRIFKKKPDARCSGKLYNFCWEEESMHLKKSAKWGPFMLWNVIYSVENTAEGDVANIKHHSPWIGTTFYLKPL